MAAVLWIAALSFKVGPFPRLGPLFEVRSGIWNHRTFHWENLKINGLRAPVKIAVDRAGVPHLFAENESDLYFAQGYVMAAHRLFQMDISSRATAGRLSELVGAKGLEMDRFFTRFGMRQSILKTTNDYMADPKTAGMIAAFVNGINAYIDGMPEVPIEYKLVEQSPEKFDASRVIAMARALTFNLNGGSDDATFSHLRQQMGLDAVLDLFPEFLPAEYSDYVLPGRWGKDRKLESASDFPFQTGIKNFPDIPRPAPGNGSNNWVVGPKKSKSGHSLLANDTHLGYSLPNIWFEMQLSVPEFNVYGTSLVNVPGIINGMNSKVAWGPTNGTSDALDFYEVEFRDEGSTDYLSGGNFKEAQVFNETLYSSDGTSELLPVVWTEWGPVLHREGRLGLVANWVGFQTKNELLSLRRLFESRTAQECLDAFTDWNVPIQNFACADSNHIGIWHAGFVPKRKVGEGRFIERAGESPWSLRESIDPKMRLRRMDPQEGFLHSANQRIADSTYGNFMSVRYEPAFRGKRIRQLLSEEDKISVDDMIKIQNDDFDLQLKIAVPILLKEIDIKNLSAEQRQWLEKLAVWDFRDRSESAEPVLAKSWFNHVKSAIFSDEYDLPERKRFRPEDMRILWMLKRVSENPRDSDARWIDDKTTPEQETLQSLVTAAFQSSWMSLRESYGDDPNQWTWKWFNLAKIPHVARLPGFGTEVLDMNGSGESVRGNKGWHGPVYKFVVEMSDPPKAFIQIPGGNSGDPFSKDFTRGVQEWARGEMRPVEFYRDWADAEGRAETKVVYSPEGT